MFFTRHLLEFWFNGILGVEDKSFANFPFGQKSSDCASELQKNLNPVPVNYPCPKILKNL